MPITPFRSVLALALALPLASCQNTTDDGGLPRVSEGPMRCGAPASLIGAIQGDGGLSPVLGRTVEVEALISARFQEGLDGFYIATVPGQDDHNPATSEGLFVVHDALPKMAQHARVRLRARVAELGEAPDTLTALIEVTALVDCGKGAVLTPVPINAAPASLDGWEALESQRVRLAGPLSVVGNEALTRAGELVVSFDGRDFSPTELDAPGPRSEARALANRLTRLVLDDGQLDTYPRKLWYLPAALTAETPWRVDSQVSGVEGVLEQRDGAWRLQLTNRIDSVVQAPRPSAPPELDADLRVASFNVLNYFNGDGKGGGFPTERGAATPADFSRQRDKIIAALSLMQADVLALMEIENDGFDEHSAIADLTAGLNAKLGAQGDYVFVKLPDAPAGGDQITVGMLYRSKRVQALGAPVLLAEEPFLSLARAPLAQTFQVGSERFTLVANHFKSKGGCDRADAPNRDLGDGQGCWNATRVAMARALWEWLQTDPTGSGSTRQLIVGDLNALGEEDPVRLLKSAGLRDVVAEHSPEPAYSYVFEGQSGRLDHALATPDMAGVISQASHWHINADEAPALEYSAAAYDARTLRARYRPDPFRSSDHDPVLIGLKFHPTTE